MKYVARCCKTCGRSEVFLIRWGQIWWCFKCAPVKMAE